MVEPILTVVLIPVVPITPNTLVVNDFEIEERPDINEKNYMGFPLYWEWVQKIDPYYSRKLKSIKVSFTSKDLF